MLRQSKNESFQLPIELNNKLYLILLLSLKLPKLKLLLIIERKTIIDVYWEPNLIIRDRNN